MKYLFNLFVFTLLSLFTANAQTKLVEKVDKKGKTIQSSQTQ